MRKSMSLVLLGIALASPSVGRAQDGGRRWYAELGGGFATSLDEAENAPGGGPYFSGFVGRRVGSYVMLGLSLGWHQYVNGAAAPFESSCPPPETPGPGCLRTRDAVEDALEIAAAIRIQPPTGTWRPYVMATLGGYRFSEDVKYLTYDRTGQDLLETLAVPVDSYGGGGGSVGVGLEYARPGSLWSVTGSARVHGVMGDPNGEMGSNSWAEFGVAVGRRF